MNKIFRHLPLFIEDGSNTITFYCDVECLCGYRDSYTVIQYHRPDKLPNAVVISFICKKCKKEYFMEYTKDVSDYSYTGRYISEEDI